MSHYVHIHIVYTHINNTYAIFTGKCLHLYFQVILKTFRLRKEDKISKFVLVSLLVNFPSQHKYNVTNINYKTHKYDLYKTLPN